MRIQSPIKNKTLPRASLVEHTSIPDGVECFGGAILSKAWKIRNDGRTPWPKGTSLLHIGGAIQPTAAITRVPLAGPGEIVKVTTCALAPTTSGYQTGSFQLCDPNNRKFGPVLEIAVTVRDLEEEEERSELEEGELPEEEQEYTINDFVSAGSHESIQIPPSALRFGVKVGEGSFGEVFEGTLYGGPVAIKRLKVHTNQAIEDFDHEIEVMKQLRHPNIVQFLGAVYEKPYYCIVTELLPNGSLQDLVTGYTEAGRYIPEVRVLDIAKQIAQGMACLHHKGIIHRDLKTANILVGPQKQLKIADLGLAHIKQTAPHYTGFYGQFGTPCYMAPEVILDQSYSFGADVFSFGIIICELLTGEYPYDNTSYVNMSWDTFDKAIVQGVRPPIPSTTSAPLKELIEQCWQPSEEARPSVDEILERLSQMQQEYVEKEDDILDGLTEEGQRLVEERDNRIVELEQELHEALATVERLTAALADQSDANKTLRHSLSQCDEQRRRYKEDRRKLKKELKGMGKQLKESMLEGVTRQLEDLDVGRRSPLRLKEEIKSPRGTELQKLKQHVVSLRV